MRPPRLRTVVKERRFERELATLRTNPHDADELVAGVEFVLARDPRTGQEVAPKCPVWFIAADQSEDSPVGLYYTFNDNEVFLLSITQGRA